mgnify:CR=1 FL=1
MSKALPFSSPGCGVILMMFTGPSTHQSPVMNCPVMAGLSNSQVTPYWLTCLRFSGFVSKAKALLMRASVTM